MLVSMRTRTSVNSLTMAPSFGDASDFSCFLTNISWMTNLQTLSLCVAVVTNFLFQDLLSVLQRHVTLQKLYLVVSGFVDDKGILTSLNMLGNTDTLWSLVLSLENTGVNSACVVAIAQIIQKVCSLEVLFPTHFSPTPADLICLCDSFTSSTKIYRLNLTVFGVMNDKWFQHQLQEKRIHHHKKTNRTWVLYRPRHNEMYTRGMLENGFIFE
jgi:hypothetical protein